MIYFSLLHFVCFVGNAKLQQFTMLILLSVKHSGLIFAEDPLTTLDVKKFLMIFLLYKYSMRF